MQSDASRNALLALGLFIGTVLLIGFVMALIRANAGEAAAALGGVIGGVIGASGAAVAVYLTLAAQWQEDRTRIRSAVVRDVIEFSRLVVGHLQTCENIAAGVISLPVPRLADAMKMPVTIIYPAIADRIGLLPSPQNVVAFYSRVVEIIMIMVPAIASDPKLQEATLKKHNITLLVEAWLGILQFARGIIEDSRHDAAFDEAVRQHILSDIQTQSTSARRAFEITS